MYMQKCCLCMYVLSYISVLMRRLICVFVYVCMYIYIYIYVFIDAFSHIRACGHVDNLCSTGAAQLQHNVPGVTNADASR